MADKKTTIRDLQTFIDAVEFAADLEQEWVPSARQWKRIRDMINSLEDTPAPTSPPMQLPAQAPTYMHAPQYAAPALPTHSNVTSSSSMPMVYQGATQATGSLSPLLTGGNSGNGQTAVRTPDIDTNGKPYSSSFA